MLRRHDVKGGAEPKWRQTDGCRGISACGSRKRERNENPVNIYQVFIYTITNMKTTKAKINTERVFLLFFFFFLPPWFFFFFFFSLLLFSFTAL